MKGIFLILSLFIATNAMAGWEFTVIQNGQVIAKEKLKTSKDFNPPKICQYKRFQGKRIKVCE